MSNIFLLWIIGSFASYRLGWALVEEEGPFSVFQSFRNLFLEDNWIGRGVRCFKCTSFWCAFVMTFLSFYSVDYMTPAMAWILWFGMAGGALVVERYWKR